MMLREMTTASAVEAIPARMSTTRYTQGMGRPSGLEPGPEVRDARPRKCRGDWLDPPRQLGRRHTPPNEQDLMRGIARLSRDIAGVGEYERIMRSGRELAHDPDEVEWDRMILV